jgi:hypothetical protein
MLSPNQLRFPMTGLFNFVAPGRCRAGKIVDSRAANLIGERQQLGVCTTLSETESDSIFFNWIFRTGNRTR